MLLKSSVQPGVRALNCVECVRCSEVKLDDPGQENMTLRWQNRIISNYEYLEYLNRSVFSVIRFRFKFWFAFHMFFLSVLINAILFLCRLLLLCLVYFFSVLSREIARENVSKMTYFVLSGNKTQFHL